MVGLVLNILVGIILVGVGIAVLNESPATAGLMKKIQYLADSAVGSSFCIPSYVAGALFLLLGFLALFIAFMIFAQTHGFWLV